MKSAVEQLNPTRVKLTVEVAFDELTAELDRAYKSLAQQVNIPGFRPGKAPAKLLEARIGRGPVLDQVLNEMIPDRYSQAISDNDLKPVSQPEIEVTKLEDGELVEFTAEVDVRPEVTLPDFSSFTVEVDALSTDEAAVDAELTKLRERFGSLKDVERAAAKGDFVTLNLSATVDGQEIEEAKADGLSHEVGSGQLIDGLDEAVEGLSVDESAEFTTSMQFGEHEGNDAVVTVVVASVKERELPEADDDFAQLASEFDTIEELRADLAKKVEEDAKTAQASAIRDEVLKQALEATEVPVPNALVEEQIQAQTQQLLNQFGGDESILDTALAAQGTSREEFDAETRTSAENNVRTQLLLDAVADDVKPEVSQDELSEHILFTSRAYGMDPNQFLMQVQQAGQLGALFADVRRGKALAAAIMQVSAKDSEGNDIDVSEYFGDEEPAAEAEAESNEA